MAFPFCPDWLQVWTGRDPLSHRVVSSEGLTRSKATRPVLFPRGNEMEAILSVSLLVFLAVLGTVSAALVFVPEEEDVPDRVGGIDRRA